jgi:hypothetical protein
MAGLSRAKVLDLNQPVRLAHYDHPAQIIILARTALASPSRKSSTALRLHHARSTRFDSTTPALPVEAAAALRQLQQRPIFDVGSLQRFGTGARCSPDAHRWTPIRDSTPSPALPTPASRPSRAPAPIKQSQIHRLSRPQRDEPPLPMAGLLDQIIHRKRTTSITRSRIS